jgi:hypothetical protein
VSGDASKWTCFPDESTFEEEVVEYEFEVVDGKDPFADW